MTPTFECKMSDVEMLGSSEDANSRCTDAISVLENHLLNFGSTAEDLIAVESEDHKDAAPFDNILPSPSSSTPQIPLTSKKRPCCNEDERTSEIDRPKRKRARRLAIQRPPSPPCDPIAYWAATFTWPTVEEPSMAAEESLPNANKRKSLSTHHSDRQQRLEENGIHMKKSALLQSASKALCDDLLTGEHKPDHHPWYPFERTDDVLERIHGLNEARLQRDVTPWIVPSGENLFFSGDMEHEYVGEEVQAEWVRCEPMGGSKPKPDLTVGLRRTAFSGDALRNSADRKRGVN
ncbi:hypothetical protein LTR74_018318 [Friedmanniomyces endolithicus]|nr:hypothetical protein LTR74_018318 [Friedmanniomyces endolithicus]